MRKQDDALNPPAPQLPEVGTEYSEAQVFWVAKHGIRRSGMFCQWSLALGRKVVDSCHLHQADKQPVATSAGGVGKSCKMRRIARRSAERVQRFRKSCGPFDLSGGVLVDHVYERVVQAFLSRQQLAQSPVDALDAALGRRDACLLRIVQAGIEDL